MQATLNGVQSCVTTQILSVCLKGHFQDVCVEGEHKHASEKERGIRERVEVSGVSSR